MTLIITPPFFVIFQVWFPFISKVWFWKKRRVVFLQSNHLCPMSIISYADRLLETVSSRSQGCPLQTTWCSWQVLLSENLSRNSWENTFFINSNGSLYLRVGICSCLRPMEAGILLGGYEWNCKTKGGSFHISHKSSNTHPKKSG